MPYDRVAQISGWGVVFGSFPDKSTAEEAVAAARNVLGQKIGRQAVIAKSYKRTTRYSAMLVALSQKCAGKARKTMWAARRYCLAHNPAAIANPDLICRQLREFLTPIFDSNAVRPVDISSLDSGADLPVVSK